MQSNPNKRCVECGKPVSRTDVLRCLSCDKSRYWAAKREGQTGPNPGGLCMCGCDQPAPIAKSGSARNGWVKGQPVRFIKGHESRPCPTQYRIDPETGCWEWLWGRDENGYGRLHNKPAHRVYYHRFVGRIPAGLQLDHLCRNRGCVNPAHMEPVTCAENVRRGANTKLTASQVEKIRTLYATGEYRQVDLARRFGVTQCHISKLVLRQAWCHDATP